MQIIWLVVRWCIKRIQQKVLVILIRVKISASAIQRGLLSRVNNVIYLAPIVKSYLKLVVLFVALTIVDRCLQYFIRRLVVFFVEDNVAISLKVLVPEMLDHLGSSLALHVLKVASARPCHRAARAIRLIFVVSFGRMRLSKTFLKAVLVYDNVSFGC